MHEKTDKRLTCSCKACGQQKELTVNEIISDFFDKQESSQLNEKLWNWFAMSLESDTMDQMDRIERSGFSLFYKDLLDLLTKLQAINQKNEKK